MKEEEGWKKKDANREKRRHFDKWTSSLSFPFSLPTLHLSCHHSFEISYFHPLSYSILRLSLLILFYINWHFSHTWLFVSKHVTGFFFSIKHNMCDKAKNYVYRIQNVHSHTQLTLEDHLSQESKMGSKKRERKCVFENGKGNYLDGTFFVSLFFSSLRSSHFPLSPLSLSLFHCSLSLSRLFLSRSFLSFSPVSELHSRNVTVKSGTSS